MKSYSIDFTDKADECLLDISAYIALDNPDRAISFVSEISDYIKKMLSVFPRAWRSWNNSKTSNGIRVLSYGAYNIYYRVLDDSQVVQILFVFNSSRNPTEIINSL